MRVAPAVLWSFLLVPARARADEPQAGPPAQPKVKPATSAAKPGAKAGANPGKNKGKPEGPAATAAPMPLPPAVLTGDGELICTISDKENGHQKLTIRNGGGLEFDVAVSPIVDGTVTTAGPDKGGSYKFTSHLAKPATGKLPGVGTFDLDELETRVMVEMTRYQQPKGKGTALTFTSRDMSARGIYIEFAGRGHARNGEKYSFRVNLGAPTDGHGHIEPADDNDDSHLMTKAVYVRAPTTTVLVTTTVDPAPAATPPKR
jgi:hypothetical protein